MSRDAIHTDAAPAAIGAYSQAVRHGDSLYVSGQIPLDPATMELVEGGRREQVQRVLDNLAAVAAACDATLDDCLKLTVYLTDLGDFGLVNEVMGEYFAKPYPARAAIGVAALPKGAAVEIDAIIGLDD